MDLIRYGSTKDYRSKIDSIIDITIKQPSCVHSISKAYLFIKNFILFSYPQSFHASLLQAPGLFVLDFMLAGVTLVAFFLFAFLFFLISYTSTLHFSRHLVFWSWISCWLVLLWYLNLLFLSFYRLIF